ncbi:ADP-heptose:LPS heptosyltransferase [Desulfobaculum xiamenense]|uniref:ADP-heptose:LPS heptosyltransferase n=1 Tax=Desulfobaculum xiamenense TaxID=995050 RepID=A0A846QI50_9BACT|nr:glycosyltransferase family 9 protein [Desulfobaculum xiamenense]NJB66780.1 ADP-heptose:LPS heptosyltransferase [Desulfobaculum xiamenense]
MSSTPSGGVRRHLVIQLARFGDLLQSKRLLVTLERRPDADVHLLVDNSLVGIARIVYPGVTVHGIAAHRSGSPTDAEILGTNLPVLAELAALNFAEVYNLNLSGLNSSLSTLFDPATVRGHRMAQGQELSDLWPRMAMRWTRIRRAAGLNLVDFWAAMAKNPVAPGEVNPVARRGGKGVGVVLAGRHSRRSLPPQMLANIAGAVVQGTQSQRVVLVGSGAERPLAREFMDVASPRLRAMTEDTVGQTDWAGLVETLAGLDAVITPDTGTMHLAAHLGVPVHALFLSSAWCFETGPYGLGHRVWQSAAQCAPCLEAADCPNDVACLASFGGRDFLRHLAGNAAFEIPEGLVGYVSAFDQLGMTYRAVLGDDPDAARRAAFRALVAQYFGLPMSGPTPDADLVERLFRETDWMLGADNPRHAMPECVPAPEKE